MIHYICKNCGSDDIRHEAWARWNNLLSVFELGHVRGTKLCANCDTKYHHLEPVEIKEAMPT